MLKTERISSVMKQGARALAVLAFLYLLNAFVQTGFITVPQLVVGLLWVSLCYILSRRISIVAILALSFGLSLAWGLMAQGVPVSDYIDYNESATRISNGQLSEVFRSKSPLTVAYFALFHWLLGTSYATNYIASAIAWTGGAAFAYLAIRPLINDESRSKFIGCGLAICPSFVVFSPVISSEAVFFLLTTVSAWLLSRHLTGWGPYPYAYIALGMVTAALFLTRVNGLLALIVCLFVIGAGNLPALRQPDLSEFSPGARRFRTPLALCAIVIAGFLLIWLAHGLLSWSSGHGFQASSSSRGPWSLMYGTNFETKGRFSASDLQLVKTMEGDEHTADSSQRALKIAIERITSDPIKFARFALTEKVRQLWGREIDLYFGAVGDQDRKDELKPKIRAPILAVLDGVYRLTFLLFLVLLIKEMRRPSHALFLGVIVLLLSLPHVFFEVRPRYHLAMTPFIIVGSMLLAHDLWNHRAEIYARIRSSLQEWARL